jgi:hypothetical protein
LEHIGLKRYSVRRSILRELYSHRLEILDALGLQDPDADEFLRSDISFEEAILRPLATRQAEGAENE